MDKIDISVVIPVKDGQRYLDAVLKGVFNQEIDAKFEVIIIDSGSTDRTLEIVRRYPVKLYQIKAAEFNHGLTRNFGISKSQGKFIILMTADAIPGNKYWMGKLVNSLEVDGSVAGAYSRQLPHPGAHPLTKARVSRFFTADKLRRESKIERIEEYNKLSPKEKHRFCSFDNVSSCIRKEVWERIPFSKTDFAEDLQWSKKVLEAGYKIVYQPESVVYHSHDFSISGWYNKNRINYNLLFSLFGLNNISNLYQLLVFFLISVFKDTRSFLRYNRHFKTILTNSYLLPLFSFAGVLGQYAGIKDCRRTIRPPYENTPDSS